MSTVLNDVPSAASIASGHHPATRTANVTGPTVDLGGDGPCFAVQQVGAVSGDGASLAGRIEESATGSSWAAIGGATFAAVTAENDVQAIRFRPTARYVRWAATVTGDTPSFAVAVLLGQQKKTV